MKKSTKIGMSFLFILRSEERRVGKYQKKHKKIQQKRKTGADFLPLIFMKVPSLKWVFPL